jgi:hypothetical protein
MGPVGFIKRAPCSFDCAKHVVFGAVCRGAKEVAVGRVEIVEGVSIARVAKDAINEVSGLRRKGGQGSHDFKPYLRARRSRGHGCWRRE